MKQFILVSYDISNDRRRRKVMKAMEDFGTRVQYSVFECRLAAPQFERLRRRLQPCVKEASDSIRFYFLSADDVGRTLILSVEPGRKSVTPDRLFVIQ